MADNTQNDNARAPRTGQNGSSGGRSGAARRRRRRAGVAPNAAQQAAHEPAKDLSLIHI